MGNQIDRYLRTEELYRQIVGMVRGDVLGKIGESGVRGVLDALLSQGKIEGRLSAYGRGAIASPSHDRLIEDWQRIVDSVSQVPDAEDRTTFEYTAQNSDVRGVIVTVHNVDGRGTGVCEDGRDVGDALRHARRSMVALGFIAEDQQVLLIEKRKQP